MKGQVSKEKKTTVDCTSNDSIEAVAGMCSGGRVVWSS